MTSDKKKAKKNKISLGWREWVSLPKLGIHKIKAKVDTGARTSALHAKDLEFFSTHGKKMIHFHVYPKQESHEGRVFCKAELVDQRHVKSSLGHGSHRPVVRTQLKIGKKVRPIELTLVNRELMGFRMLIGREAIRGDYVIDPSRSFLVGQKPKKRKNKGGKKS